MSVRAKLKRLHSPDVWDLEKYSPGDVPFGFLLQAMIGPLDTDGEDLFQFVVCTPDWFADNLLRPTKIISGEHTLFVTEYDYKALRGFIERAVHREEAATWDDLARQLSWLGDWEFSDYDPYVDRSPTV